MSETNNTDNMLEPEEYICSAKYLIELIQMDMNFGRKDTVPARLDRAISDLSKLQNYFPAPRFDVTEEMAENYYKEKGFTRELPTSVGLYQVATKESDYLLSYVAATLNDYRDIIIHDDLGICDARNYGEKRGGGTVFWKKVN